MHGTLKPTVDKIGCRAALLFALLLFSLPALADTAATVTHLSGMLAVRHADGTSQILSVKSQVREGDTLITQQDSYARVKFHDGGEIVLRPNSQLRLDAYSFSEGQPQKDNFVASLLKGGFRAVTGLLGHRSRDQFSVKTANATIGIRGTHFGAFFCNSDCADIPTVSGKAPDNGLHLDVADGKIVVSNNGGTRLFDTGQFGFVRDANTTPSPVPPELGIRVTMPPSISTNKAGGKSIGQEENIECVQ